jgi:hypothetical protein
MDVKPLTKSELERLVDQLSKVPRVDSAVIQTRRRPSRRNDADGSPAARIKRLLTVEAGLSQEQSIDQLRLELGNLPGVFLPKKASFDRWLDAVLSRGASWRGPQCSNDDSGSAYNSLNLAAVSG